MSKVVIITVAVTLIIVVEWLLISFLWILSKRRQTSTEGDKLADRMQRIRALSNETTFEAVSSDLCEKGERKIQSDLCSICLLTFDAKTTILQLQCGHIYHVECIEGWAKNASKFSCPTCRCACLEQDDHHNPRDCCAPIDLPPVHAS